MELLRDYINRSVLLQQEADNSQKWNEFLHQVKQKLHAKGLSNPTDRCAKLVPSLYQKMHDLVNLSYEDFLQKLQSDSSFRNDIIMDLVLNALHMGECCHADIILHVALRYLDNPHFDCLGAPLFIRCVENNDLFAIQALINLGADVNISCCAGMTGLHLAARSNKLQTVCLLLQNNANPNIADHQNITALMRAVIGGHTEIVRLLLAHGANAKVIQPPLSFAGKAQKLIDVPMNELFPVMQAHHHNGDDKPLDALLAQYNINAGAKTLIDLAIENHHYEIAELLKAHGVRSYTQSGQEPSTADE